MSKNIFNISVLCKKQTRHVKWKGWRFIQFIRENACLIIPLIPGLPFELVTHRNF